ncbi:MAG: TraB/GumN family protein [Flavobacteriales bacterium]
MIKNITINTITVLVACLFTHNMQAQDKYPSLLWEISGNGLEKSSYLYGTMHVSSKLAFHLTDNFFQSLENVDIVALESDPTQWLNETEESEDAPMLSPNRFYRQFQDKYLDKYNLARQLASDHAMINGLLYRSNSALQDFQEDTYLDMFIFQAGSRFGKPIVGLENFKESRELVKTAYKEKVVKEDLPSWLNELLKEKNYDIILRDSYRNNNLDMIDSLNNGYSTEHYLEHMLFKRNDNMVEVYDSIINLGKTIFAGVGAAHLPGKRGMIEGFRAKGYTVKPIKGPWTSKGKSAKKRIEDKRKARSFTTYKSSDGFIEFGTPTEVHEISIYNKTMYLAPDLTNGSYIAVSRMKLNEFIKEKDQDVLDFESIDKILIEYIPGKIKSKKDITVNGIKGLDIKTETKAGDHHRYCIFKTPMEFIIVKMVGKGDYVLKESNQVFDKIAFHYSNNWTNVTPAQGGFSVEVPNYYFLDNNGEHTKKIGSPFLQAYDTKSDAFFFLKQNVLNDNVFIEKDEFELKRIQEVYFEELDIEDFEINVENKDGKTSVVGVGKTENNTKITLKTIIKGAHYYMLGAVNAQDKDIKKYFNSFQFEPMIYGSETEVFEDTNLYYTVNTYKKAVDENNNYQYSKVKANETEVKRQTFSAVSKQQVSLKYHKYNNFDQYEHIDSIWHDIVEYKKELTQIVEDTTTGQLSNGDPYLSIIMSDTASDRRLRFKYIIHGGVQYKLSTVMDKDEVEKDAFVNSIFDSFLPMDTMIGVSPMDKKASAFFEVLYSENDSLNDQAYDHYHDVLFFDEDKKRLIETIENFDFDDEQMDVKKSLITSFCKLDSDDRSKYLIKWYNTFEDNADLQIHILKQLSKEGDKASYKTIGGLLETDIPLPYKEYKITNLFYTLNKNPELEEEILNEIMGLLSISEYQESVLETLSKLQEEEIVDKRYLKKFKNQFIAMAKVELKRSRSAQIANNQNTYSTADYDKLDYLIDLLFPFRKEDEVKDFYKKIEASTFEEQKINLLTKAIKAKDNVEESELLGFATDIKNRILLYQSLEENALLSHFPKAYNSLDSISLSTVHKKFVKKKEDKMEFYKKENLIKDGDNYTLMLYKFKTEDYSGKEETKLVYAIYEDGKWADTEELKNEGEFKEEDEKETLKLIKDKFILSDHPRVSHAYSRNYGW